MALPELVGKTQVDDDADFLREGVRTPGWDLAFESYRGVAVRPGSSVTLEFVRRMPGEYEFYCSRSTSGTPHRALGMEGKFIVVP